MNKNRISPEIYFLDPKSALSLQAQVRETIVRSIVSGQVSPGSILPSTRRFAAHLGLSRMTVTLAYQELVAQGYLDTRSRSGYVIADVDMGAKEERATPTRDSGTRLNWSQRFHTSLVNRKRIKKPLSWRDYPYPFVYGQIDSASFDHEAWRACMRQAMGKRDFDELAGDLLDSDDPILVKHICMHTLPRRGISARPEEILLTVGAQNGLWLALELLIRPGMRVVCENPGYPDTIQAVQWHKADIYSLDIDEFGLPPEKLPNDIHAVVVTPSHHSPTGVTLPRDRRLELLQRALRDDFVIIEDDYEFEMSYLAPPAPALKSFDHSDRVIYIGSFSKSIFPGLRIGYLVGPEAFIAEARELRSLVLRHPPGHLQRTSAYFLSQGHYDRLVRKTKSCLMIRRQALEEALEGSCLEIAGAASFGGSSLWIRAPECIDTEKLQQALLDRGVIIEPGAPFFSLENAYKNYFRLGYSSIPVERIRPGIEIIIEECQKMA